MSDMLGIIGGGKIGEALLTGLLRGERTSSDIVVVEKHHDRANYLTTNYGVKTLDVPEAAAAARTLVLCVKPQDIGALLAELAQVVTTEHLIVSVAAGIPTAKISAALPEGVPVVRCMPNTPALVDEAMTAVSAGAYADEPHLATAEALLASVGRVVRVPETQLDAVTALSGSGPAYFFYLVEGMIEAGVLIGLSRPVATELVVQTMLGSARMLIESGEHPAVLREAVTSPGGTTASALHELDRQAVKAALAHAIQAARDRSVQLGTG
jgi:pyrroline-5-carboxylate reductase